MLRREFLREASDPMKPSQPFHTGRPGKPRPISALRPVMLAARRLADEVHSTFIRAFVQVDRQVQDRLVEAVGCVSI